MLRCKKCGKIHWPDWEKVIGGITLLFVAGLFVVFILKVIWGISVPIIIIRIIASYLIGMLALFTIGFILYKIL